MTVLRQLYFVVTVLLTALFICSVTSSDIAGRSERQAQLQRSVQQLVRSMHGRTLVWQTDGPNLADALIDSGPYRRVSISATDGSLVVRRARTFAPAEVPEWFVRLQQNAPSVVPLQIDDRPIGTVEAVVDTPTIAAIVWHRDLGLLGWFVATWLLLLGLIKLLISRTLRPLRLVVAQANALAQRDYPIQQVLPATPELRDVTLALNRLSSTLRKMVDAQMQALTRLRDDAYRDKLTGLPNRRFLDLHLQQLIDGADQIVGGAVLLLSVQDAQPDKPRKVDLHFDAVLVQATAMIKAMTQADAGPDYFIARYADTEFAISISPASEREALALAARLVAGLQQMRPQAGNEQRKVGEVSEAIFVGHVGIALYRHRSVAQWLSDADSALRVAQARGPNTQHLYLSGIEAMGEQTVSHMADFLRTVIEQKNIILHLQPVLACGNSIRLLQYEVLLRAVGDDGHLMTAAYFVPMAKRLGLIQKIDRLVITEVLLRLRQKRYGTIRVAVNLSPASMHDSGFVGWLLAALRAAPTAAQFIAFEVSEVGMLEQMDAMRPLVEKIRQFGAQFGIDRVGRGFSSFDYLSSMPLNYLKIDGSFVRGIADQRDNQLLLDSICKVAHGLDVIVIAETVETDEEWQCLRGLQIDGVQGYGVGMPAEI